MGQRIDLPTMVRYSYDLHHYPIPPSNSVIYHFVPKYQDDVIVTQSNWYFWTLWPVSHFTAFLATKKACLLVFNSSLLFYAFLHPNFFLIRWASLVSLICINDAFILNNWQFQQQINMTHISFLLYIINNYFKCATKITKQFKPQNLNLQL